MDIENPWLFKHLVEWLRSEGINQTTIDGFAQRWSKVTPHTPLPCPNCFIGGREGHLQALDAISSIEPVRCKECRTEFDIPITK